MQMLSLPSARLGDIPWSFMYLRPTLRSHRLLISMFTLSEQCASQLFIFRLSLFRCTRAGPRVEPLKVCRTGWVSYFLATCCHSWENNNFFADHKFHLFWRYRRMDEWMDGWMCTVDGGINSKSRRLFCCSRWRSSRCRSGEGLRFPSSVFHYDAPWQHGEWMCGRIYSLPISTTSTQSHSCCWLPSLLCFQHIETGGDGVGDGWPVGLAMCHAGRGAVPALVSIIIWSHRGTLSDSCENWIVCTFCEVFEGHIVCLVLFFKFVIMFQ